MNIHDHKPSMLSGASTWAETADHCRLQDLQYGLLRVAAHREAQRYSKLRATLLVLLEKVESEVKRRYSLEGKELCRATSYPFIMDISRPYLRQLQLQQPFIWLGMMQGREDWFSTEAKLGLSLSPALTAEELSSAHEQQLKLGRQQSQWLFASIAAELTAAEEAEN